MKNNPMDIAVVCENKQQREHALEIAQANGIALGKWQKETERGNILRLFDDGDWQFWDWNGGAKTILTYDKFIAKYGNNEQPQPDPIAEMLKRLEAVEQRVFGNTEQATVEIGSDSININPYEPMIQTLPFIVPAPEQASDKSFFEHKNLTAPNQFGNYHRFTDEQGNEFEAPTEVCDKRICIDHVTGLSHECRVVEVDDEEEPTEPKPEPVYDGVFWFEGTGRASCINGQQTMAYSERDYTWLIWSSEDLPKHRHRLVNVKEFTVGKWYACEGLDLNGLFGYSMYLGDNRFVSWTMKEDYPILIHNQEKWRVQLLEVQQL